MPELSENEALGRAIRTRRESASLTQAELGRRAGYKTGAAVSISRVEAGSSRPSPERLTGIATTLGCSVRRLENEAAALRTPDATEPETSRPHSTRAWLQVVRERIEHRQQRLATALEAFETEHDRARDDFFLPFLAAASRISDAPAQPGPEPPEDDEPPAQQQAQFRLRSASTGFTLALAAAVTAGFAGAATGGVAAYATFVAASAFGTASTGAAISGLSGAAAANAALAALGGGSLAAGGAGIAGGAAVLAGIVAAPMAILAVGGALWMVRRNRRQETELREQLQQAQDKLDQTEAGFLALLETLKQSAAILGYIATHAGHALTRWRRELLLPVSWRDLPESTRQSYGDFNAIAACQVTLVTVDMLNYLTLTGEALEEFIAVTDEVVLQRRKEVESLV